MIRLFLALCLLSGSSFAQLTALVTPNNPTPPLPAATFTPVSPLILNDSGGNHWAVTMDDFGILHSAATATSTTKVYQLLSFSDQTSWTLGITTGGQITTTGTAYNAALPTTFSFLTTHGHNAILWNISGILRSNTPQ